QSLDLFLGAPFRSRRRAAVPMPLLDGRPGAHEEGVGMLGFLTTHRRYGLLLTGPVIVTSMVLVVIGASAAAAVTFPGVPSGLTAVATGPQAVKVTWNPSSGAQSYRVLRNAKLVAASVIGTTYTDAGPLPHTAYSYPVA